MVVAFQPTGDLLGVFAVTLHPQRQGLDPHQRVMRRLRVQRHAEVTQTNGDAVEGEGQRSKGLMELQAVIGGLRRGQGRELVAGRPVKLARVDNHAAGDRTVAGQVFGHRMHHQCRAMFDRAAEVRRGRGVINDQRQANLVGNGRDRRQVGHIAAGVRDRFTENRAGVVIHSGLNRGQIFEINKLGRPAEPFDGLAELGDRATIKTGGHHHVIARLHQREQRHDLGCVARRAANRADAAFQRGHTFLQNRHGRVGQTRVDVTHLLQVKQRGRVVCIAEHIGGRLIDRGLAGTSGRIGAGACVDLQRVEAIVRGVGHAGFLLKNSVGTNVGFVDKMDRGSKNDRQL